jgi:hypothetical protein
MPAGEGYERFIQRSACLPTRDNLHDFFHALVWLHCPGLKARMQALAMCELLRQRPGEPRGSVRDALTLLDENGALFWGDEPIWQALCARDWPAAFGRWHATTAPHSGPDVAGEALNGGELGVPGERQGDAHGEGVPALQVVGHALLEKLTRPRKSLCAHLWQLDGPPEVGAQPRDSELQAKPHAVLPLLGVPGWWADNLLPGFYDDASVFRPAMKPFGAKGSLSKAT